MAQVLTPQQQFINKIAKAAQLSAAKTKVPASFTIAQGALESGWGGSQLATQANNLFGIKASPDWKGLIWLKPTREFLNGQWVTVDAKWRKYPDWQGCMDDHGQFFHTYKRYAPAFLTKTGEDFATAIAKAGYATDPSYASLLISIIRKYNLAQYDVQK